MNQQPLKKLLTFLTTFNREEDQLNIILRVLETSRQRCQTNWVPSSFTLKSMLLGTVQHDDTTAMLYAINCFLIVFSLKV